MSKPLDQLTKAELLALLEQREQQVADRERVIAEKERILAEKEAYEKQLLAMIEKFKRMSFAQKRERFEGNKDQMDLPFEPTQEQERQQQEEFSRKVEYIRRKRPAHTGRQPLPDHLPTEEIEIHPEGDLTGMECIGKEVTEELDYIPAQYIRRRYIRYKYAPKDKYSSAGVKIGLLPERAIPKGIPGYGLLTDILTRKYLEHMPLYRQAQRFKREKIPIAPTTLEGWVKQGLEKLEPLYDCLVADTKAMGYLMVDESTIRVLDGDKKGACHTGYYWVYHNPLEKTVLFDYRPTRGKEAPSAILENFKGYLQSDGYAVYEHYADNKEVTHLACWAHARRKYFEALVENKKLASEALGFIGKLYDVERKAKKLNLSAEDRKKLRLDEALPVINKMSEWIKKQLPKALPKSELRKALFYSANRWAELSNYLYDGELEIDNNPVEREIRSMVVGRKNYLFAGSHKAAQRAAMIYSFFGICKLHDVNPQQWLEHALRNIMTINHKNIRDLYPQNFNHTTRG
ncbi:IS66 family transposase [Echinicola soli]|uniref:IS66 family transposase n=1 Tax=Echinicola soli TaxID=2591634 RepID=A0A514CFG8_9BACT|nr:IS66 family transposase [Echinicola soli]QDH78404.1 IS66 family transposase [Echinicola soli]